MNILTQSQLEDAILFLKNIEDPSFRVTLILLSAGQILEREFYLGHPDPWSHPSVQAYITAAIMTETGHIEDAFAEAEILRLNELV